MRNNPVTGRVKLLHLYCVVAGCFDGSPDLVAALQRSWAWFTLSSLHEWLGLVGNSRGAATRQGESRYQDCVLERSSHLFAHSL